MTEQRGNWSSSAGFILAATGSAIGLGNLWKFPFITWENNGGAFVLVYLLCIAAVGLPIMMAELALLPLVYCLLCTRYKSEKKIIKSLNISMHQMTNYIRGVAARLTACLPSLL